MSAALNATGRPILFAMCEWGVSSPWLYAQNVSLLGRVSLTVMYQSLLSLYGTVLDAFGRLFISALAEILLHAA